MIKRPFRAAAKRSPYRPAATGRTPPRFLATWKGSAVVALLFCALFVIAARLDLAPDSTRIEGRAVVNDGDTLTVAGQRLRLKGIDAPELNQLCRREGTDYACGRSARDALTGLTQDAPVLCEGWRRDRYGRLLVTCSDRRGRDIGADLVRSGWAVSYGSYESEERIARNAGSGLWAGTFERPSEWRASRGDAGDGGHGVVGAIVDWLHSLFRG